MQDDATVLHLAERGHVPRSGASECFADEVAIDFPSVAPIVERLCGRFLVGDPSEEFQWTEVQISRRDAASGGRVPLALTVRAMCDRCGGRGESWEESCHACEGSGARRVRRDVAVVLPCGVRDGARFLLTVVVADAGVTRVHLQVTIP